MKQLTFRGKLTTSNRDSLFSASLNKMFSLKLVLAFAAMLVFNASFAQTSMKYSVYFDVNQSKIKTKDYLVLDTIVGILKTQKNIKRIQINGYADTTGGAEANLELSNNRTDTVAGYILSKGLMVQYKNKVSTSSLGEKVSGKETDLTEMRRVDIVLVLAKPDRDTTVKMGCISAIVKAGTFEGFNNDEVVFKLQYIGTADEAKKLNLNFKDDNGQDLLSNGIVKLVATYKGKPVKSIQPIVVNIPKINNESGYSVYKGIEDKTKNVTWKLTDNTVTNLGVIKAQNGEDCDVQSMTITNVNAWFNAAKLKPKCLCSADPFGGLQVPEKGEPLVRFGPSKGILQVKEGSFKKVSADKAFIQLVDNLTPEEYLNFCNSFMFPGIGNIPKIPKYTTELVRFVDVNVSQKNDTAELIMNKKDQVLLFIPKSQLPAHKGKKYVVLPADTKKDNFYTWTKKIVFNDSCMGLANCDYYIFEVPFSGFYSILEVTPTNTKAGAKGEEVEEEETAPPAKTVKVKVKNFNGVNIVYGLKDENKTTEAALLKNKGKHSIIGPEIAKKDKKNYRGHLFLAYVVKDGKRYAWIGYGSELKTNLFTGNWKTPKLVYVPDEEWESFIKKACE
ncbi:MAG: OmpA family protein [Bacteroidota bacterium]